VLGCYGLFLCSVGLPRFARNDGEASLAMTERVCFRIDCRAFRLPRRLRLLAMTEGVRLPRRLCLLAMTGKLCSQWRKAVTARNGVTWQSGVAREIAALRSQWRGGFACNDER